MTEATCGDCGREPRTNTPGDVFFEMKPGRDREPWWLCMRCWVVPTDVELPRGRRR